MLPHSLTADIFSCIFSKSFAISSQVLNLSKTTYSDGFTVPYFRNYRNFRTKTGKRTRSKLDRVKSVCLLDRQQVARAWIVEKRIHLHGPTASAQLNHHRGGLTQHHGVVCGGGGGGWGRGGTHHHCSNSTALWVEARRALDGCIRRTALKKLLFVIIH